MKVMEKHIQEQLLQYLFRKIKKNIIYKIIIFIILLTTTGCFFQNTAKIEKTKYTIGVVLKSMDSEHWMSVKAGLEQAAYDYNVNIIILSPKNETAVDEQRRMIFDLLNRDIDALVIAPCNINESDDYIKLAKKKKIPLFTIDEKIGKIPYIGSDNFNVGELAAKELKKHIENNLSAKIAIISGNKYQNAHSKRVDGFKTYIKKNTNFIVLDEKFADSNFEEAYKKTKEIISEKPDVSAIFVTSAVMGLGVVQALEDMKIQRKIHLVGVDTQDDFILEVKQKKVDAIIAQKGSDVGKLAIKTVFQSLEDKTVLQNAYIKNNIITAENAQKYLSP